MKSGIPYEFLTPNYELKTTILLLHGFNSAPGNKENSIKQWLKDNNRNTNLYYLKGESFSLAIAE